MGFCENGETVGGCVLLRECPLLKRTSTGCRFHVLKRKPIQLFFSGLKVLGAFLLQIVCFCVVGHAVKT